MTDRRDVATDGQVVSADGTRIGVRRVGAGQPVVLVHGSYGGLDSFQAVAEGLSDSFECWLMARRGHAPSDTPNQANTFAAEVHDVLAVLAAAHDRAGTGRRPHLVGGSYGATLALHTALTDPHALGALALFEPPLFAAGPGLVPVLSQYRALLAADDLTGASRLFAQQVARAPATLLAGSDDDDPPDGDPDVTSTGTRVPVDDRDPAGAAVRLRIARAALHDLEAMTTDSEDVTRWSAIGSPTLVIGGSESWTPLPETMDALVGTLSQVEQVVLAGQNHFVTATAPDLVTRALHPFLQRCS